METIKVISGDVPSQISPEQKEDLIIKFGSLLHDEWRAPRKREDSSFEPRIKVLIKTENGDEKWFDENKVPEGSLEIKRQDIANLSFEELDPKWQYENRAAAEVAMNEVLKAIEKGVNIDEDFIEAASSMVHEKWLERNSWVFDENYGNKELAKPYLELPEEEKEKDRAQIRKAVEIYSKG